MASNICQFLSDGEGAAGYELSAKLEWLEYTTSDTMSLEITDTRLQLRSGAGLPDKVLDAWQGS